MAISVLPFSLSDKTMFRRGDFNIFSTLYTEMMMHGVVKDCVPVVDKNYICFQLYKSAFDQAPLYLLSIWRDQKNDRFVYEAKTAEGLQITQGPKLDKMLQDFKWFLGKKHHIQAWQKPKNQTD